MTHLLSPRLTLAALALVCIPAPAQAPPGVDLRPAFAEFGLQLRHQGARGTCSVFAVTGALEFARARAGEHGACFSVEFLNWAANDSNGKREDGSYFADLWQGYLDRGICDEADLPYRAEFDAAAGPGREALWRAWSRRDGLLELHWIKPWDIDTGLSEAHFAAIRDTLRGGWPVCAGMRWPKQAKWTDGVIEWAPPEGVRDGHSVLLVGYRDDPAQPGGGVFLIRNSSKGPADGALPYRLVRDYTNDALWIAPRATTAATARPALDLSLLDPLGAPVVGRNRRVSSNEQPKWHDENLDMNWLMPGESVAMPLLRGPGVITHIWFTSHAGWAGELDALVLRIYWDGQEAPGVEVPLADFFAVGQGRPASVESLPVQVSPSGSLTCYWRMPFRESARIVVTNDNPDRSTGLYWQVDWVQVDELSATTPYFYAKYRRENPAAPGDYVIADLAGTGCFVGTVQSVTLGQDGWPGEGDDFFYVDGEKVPSLQGTGTEDYFNDAWGYRVRTGPWFGQPRWQGYAAGDSGVAYRWHLADPVFFTTSLRFAIEHKGNHEIDENGFFLERPDFLSSVAFWYQLGAPKPFDELPPFHERRVPWQRHHLVKAYREAQTSDGSPVRVLTQGFFGARPVLQWAKPGPGAVLTVPFALPAAGRFAVRLGAGNGPANGSFDVQLDGTKVKTMDLHAVEDGEVDVALGVHEFAAGAHTLAFRTATEGDLVVEELRLLPLPPEVQRDVRTHHEAHFVRLGIGRAVYAYRLAFGELPASLQAMVDAGFMPERYLRDENNLPLRSACEDGRFVVESDGPGHWQHSWRGLDARR
jgi:hypothetical protein